jgi:hypothetical protein
MRVAAFLLLAAWAPIGMPWALALVALADRSHHLSLGSSHGVYELVLHHHDIPSDTDGDVLEAADHPHCDHVIHGPGPGRVLAASSFARGDRPSQLCVHGNVGFRAVACDRSVLRVAARSSTGPAPPTLRTVLRI